MQMVLHEKKRLRNFAENADTEKGSGNSRKEGVFGILPQILAEIIAEIFTEIFLGNHSGNLGGS